jgi:hypothetical protein
MTDENTDSDSEMPENNTADEFSTDEYEYKVETPGGRETACEVTVTSRDDAGEQAEIEAARGVPRSLMAERDATVEALYDHADVLNAYRFPDADAAREFFDAADQYSEIEVEVQLDGTTSTIVGEVGYRWDVVVETDGGLVEVIPEYDLTIEGGHVQDKGRGWFRVRYFGLWNDRADLYERVRDLLEQVNNFDPPRHRKQAFRWRQADYGPVPVEADDGEESGGDTGTGEA